MSAISFEPTDGMPNPGRQRAIIAVCLAVLLAQIDYAIANVALPAMGTDLHASASDTVWIVNAYQLASLSSILPLAAAGAWLGYERVCMGGIVLFMLASCGCALAPSLPVLTCARAFQGFGAACMLGVTSALIRFIYPRKELGKGVALNTLIVGLGMALGPTVAGLVLAVADWPWLFWINLPLGLLTLLLAATSLPRTPRQGDMPDPWGVLLCMLSFFGLGLAGNGMAHADGITLTIAFLVGGLFTLLMLVRREHGRALPILPVDLLRGRSFRTAFLVGLCGYVSSNFFIISFPFALHDHYNWNATSIGLMMLPWAFGLIASASVTRPLADRIPAGILSSLGLLCTMAGFILLHLLPDTPSAFDVLWRVGLAGLGFGIFQVPNNRAMLLSAAAGREGGASGMVQVSRQGGQTLGGIGTALTLRLTANGTQDCLNIAALCAAFAAALSASRLTHGNGGNPRNIRKARNPDR
ncbi:MFS transporter [Acetobacter estunensis]|nr:MFS transporter [Acetobacter estunensis]